MQSPSDSPLPVCQRLCLSHIVEMFEDRDETSLLELGESANDLLDTMRKRGLQDSIKKTIVELVLREKDLEGLKKLLASLRKKVASYDANQAGVVQRPATLAPALPPLAPAELPFRTLIIQPDYFSMSSQRSPTAARRVLRKPSLVCF